MLVERGWIKSLNHVSLPCLANTPLFESFPRTRRKRKTSRREPARLLSPACSGNEFLDVSRGVFRPPLNAHLPSHLRSDADNFVSKLVGGLDHGPQRPADPYGGTRPPPLSCGNPAVPDVGANVEYGDFALGLAVGEDHLLRVGREGPLHQGPQALEVLLVPL